MHISSELTSGTRQASRRFALLLVALLAVSLFSVIYPMYVIRPFRPQANSSEKPHSSVPGVVLSMICWLVTGILLLLYVDAWIKAGAGRLYCGQQR